MQIFRSDDQPNAKNRTSTERKPNRAAREAVAREREAIVLDTLKTGGTFEQAAAAAGYRSKASAHEAAQRALAALAEETKAETADARDVLLGRLQALLDAVWSDAMRGDVVAVESARRLIESAGRLRGLLVAPPLPPPPPVAVTVSFVQPSPSPRPPDAATPRETRTPPLEPAPAAIIEHVEPQPPPTPETPSRGAESNPFFRDPEADDRRRADRPVWGPL